EISRALQHQAMTLVVGRRAVLAMQISGIHGRITEGDLIVIRIVERLGKCIRAMELEVLSEPVVDGEPQSVVVRVDGRLQIGHGDLRIADRTDRYADDEVRAQVVDAVYFHDPIFRELVPNTQVEL